MIKKFNEMNNNREVITLPKKILSNILQSVSKSIISHDDVDYQLVEDEIYNSDPEDGGADHTVIFKRLSDNKYFRFEYCDWDLYYNFNRDFPEQATEVFPKSITTIIYT